MKTNCESILEIEVLHILIGEQITFFYCFANKELPKATKIQHFYFCPVFAVVLRCFSGVLAGVFAGLFVTDNCQYQ